MSLQVLCNAAQAAETNSWLTKVVDIESKQLVLMNLKGVPKTILKGGTIRAIFDISQDYQIKVHVFSCKRRKYMLPCNACLNKSHHRCENPVYLHLLVRK